MSDKHLTYPEWISQNLDGISEAFLKGMGYGDIFESQYLCYLECLVASRGLDPAGMWKAWSDRVRVVASLKDTEKVQALNRYLKDKAKLVEELVAFRTKWAEGPTPHSYAIKMEKQEDPTPKKAKVKSKKAEPKKAEPKKDPPKLGTGRPEKTKPKKKPEPTYTGEGLFDLFGGG